MVTPALVGPVHPAGQKLRDAFVAVSLANLCFLTASFRLLYSADHGYFNKLSAASPALLALATNILGLALVIWLLLRIRRRLHKSPLCLAIDFLFFLSLLFPVDFCRRTVFQIPDYAVVAFLKRPLTLIGIVVLLTLLVWQHRRIARFAAISVGLLSPLALFALSRLALMSLGCVVSERPTPEQPLLYALPARDNQPRVVWIIFDEMDRRVTFDERPPLLKLPAFDQLRTESLDATNAHPPGESTLISMPALISGRRLSAVEILNRSDLSIALADTGVSTNWSKLPSVFDAARKMGINSGVVGWYHPYSRVLGYSLSYCSWYPFPHNEPARAPSFGESMLRELGCLGGPVYLRQVYIDLCRRSISDSLSLVTNATYGLVLLHLPPPHKPGIYNIEKDAFTPLGMPKITGYFNNLALADGWLGQLRGALDKSGQSRRTWLIVSADHSWRESTLYDAKRDTRVPFLLKAPNSTTGATCPTQINTILTHDLILAILGGEVTGQEDALTWLTAHGSTELPVAHQRSD